MLVYSNFLVIFTLIGDIKAENNTLSERAMARKSGAPREAHVQSP